MKSLLSYPRRAMSVAMAVVLFVAIVPFQPVVAFGASTTWYVDGMAGDDGNPGTVAEPFASIYAAVDAADDGDTILVKPGTYWCEPLVIGGFSGLTIASTGGAAATRLRGFEEAPVVVIVESEGVTLEGFTITEGAYDFGGGVLVEAATAKISNCVITRNYAWGGGGIGAWESTLTVEGCEVVENFGFEAAAGILSVDSTMTVTDCAVTDNGDFYYEPGWHTEFGGGAVFARGKALITGTTFDGNVAQGAGGVFAGETRIDLVDCVFTANEAAEGEGVLFSLDASEYLPEGLAASGDYGSKLSVQRIKAAQVYWRPRYGAGGGLAVYNAEVTVSGTEFSDNSAYWDGGGLYAGYWSALDVSDCSFDGNTGFLGGGLYYADMSGKFIIETAKPGSYEELVETRAASGVAAIVEEPESGFEPHLSVERSVFAQNRSLAGSAVFSSTGAPASIDNCLFEGNYSYDVGTVIAEIGRLRVVPVEAPSVTELAEEPISLAMANCTFNGNTAYDGANLAGNGVWDVRNTIFWGSMGSESSGILVDAFAPPGATFTYCDLEHGYSLDGSEPVMTGEGNFSEDPLFGAGSTLTATSPCIDAGTSEGAPADDIDGWFRPMDGDGDGTRAWDVGAYEYYDALARNVGANRYETAVKSCQQHFDSAETVIVATGEVFADGLSAAGLAGSYAAPILISPKAVMPALVKAEIDRLGATDAIVVGGVNAVSAAVMSDLVSMGLSVERIGGADRYETAALVAKAIAENEGGAFSGLGFVARGDTFPDALSVSPIAYAMKSPILLVKPDSMPQATVDVIEALSFDEFMVAGGPDAVGSMAVGGLAAETVQIGGIDRYDTSAKVSDYAVDKGWAQMSYTGIATGENFPDALTGGAALGAENGVLLLTPKAALHSSAKFLMQKRAAEVKRVEIMGGTAAISDAVWDAIDAILN